MKEEMKDTPVAVISRKTNMTRYSSAGITTFILKLSNTVYGLNNIYHPWLS